MTEYEDILVNTIKLLSSTVEEKLGEIQDVGENLKMEFETIRTEKEELEESLTQYQTELNMYKQKVINVSNMTDFVKEIGLDVDRNYSLYDLNRIKKAISDLEL